MVGAMGAKKRKKIRLKLEDKRRRLDLYKLQEKRMLENGVQSYGIGSRNLARYNLDLKAIQAEIEVLEDEIDELVNALEGCKARKAAAVVIRDW